ncbi:Hpt domain-containing protein [Chryseolinea lacunae]|uniref:Hpt domain-containing protein n=1 Tax=Chryseolinea lacunae TaxID=2801331 RepID=A0ABS1L2H0_9BACT|nr:Hpt domain-containing protein [Chryseolinea lacunae]MBL0745834.1 Hpt domain-containing protein [Chryseolinea lacunae]
MNHETHPEPCFDLTLMQQASNGNPAFMQRMINLFCVQATETIAAWHTAIAGNDYDAIRKIAHKIKPTLDALCIAEVHNDIRWLETIDSRINLRHDVLVVVNRVGHVLTHVAEQLQSTGQSATN